MKLLDLFCGAGGASAGYARAGFEVVGVDIEDHPDYPFELKVADALEVLEDWDYLSQFDVIHASPPCQTWTAYRRRGDGVGDGYVNLIPETREGLLAWGGVYVIENVPKAPLHDPIQLCGSSFGLDVRRHRLFESNVPLLAPPCDHAWQTPRFTPASNRTNLRRTVEIGVWRIPLAIQQEAMGIDWMKLADLTEAIPPAYAEHIGGQILQLVNEEAA